MLRMLDVVVALVEVAEAAEAIKAAAQPGAGQLGLSGEALGALLLWLALSMRSAERRQPWLLLTASIRDGRGATTISLSSRSLHALVAYVGERVEGVRQVLPTVRRAEEGWVIRCEVQLWTSASAPETSRALREALTHQLEHHTGVPVAALRLDCTYDLETEREALR